jgi:hypothetical protein
MLDSVVSPPMIGEVCVVAKSHAGICVAKLLGERREVAACHKVQAGVGVAEDVNPDRRVDLGLQARLPQRAIRLGLVPAPVTAEEHRGACRSPGGLAIEEGCALLREKDDPFPAAGFAIADHDRLRAREIVVHLKGTVATSPAAV